MTPLSLSQSLLLVDIGATAYLAMVHLWLGRSRDPVSRWAGAWAAFAAILAAARLAQLSASTPEAAILAARVYAASAPLLIGSLCRLVRAVTGGRPKRFETHIGPALCGAAALLALTTPAFVCEDVIASTTLDGAPYIGAPAGPLVPLLGLQMALALWWMLRALWRAPHLHRLEKRGFTITLGIYAAMGATSVASSLGLIEAAGVAEYGPLVVALGAGRLLAIRQRRLERSLEERAEARTADLRESEARYRSVIENAPIGLISIDAAGRLEDTNAALLEMLDSTREQFAARFDVSDAQNVELGFTAMLATAFATGETRSGEFEFDTWSGRRLATRTTVAPRHDAAGRIVGALAIVEDVTQQRLIERQLQQTQRMEAVGQLAAGIAHEINNPMAYVRANLTTLAEEVGELGKRAAAEPALAETRERIGEMEALVHESLQGVLRTIAIVRDLREFSRTGRVEPEPTDVNALVENAARLATTHRAGAEQIVERLEPLPPVSGAPSQLLQLFLNLFVNALHAAEAESVVTVSTQRRGDRVLVRVHDEAPTLSPEARARLFEPYAPTQARHAEPSLGLYISQQIAHAHGGELRVVSDDVGGNTLEVRLPVAATHPT
jgi:PAS domain S-box-containing protein